MSDYNATRDAAGKITSCFEKMLENLVDDYEDELVVVSLMRHYKLCLDNDDASILEAIERVLEDYMSPSDFNAWMLTVEEK
jgi:hypothetical protein